MVTQNYENLSLVPSPLSHMQRKGVWTNLYRACVAHAAYSVHQSDARIKSHDCANMNGMHIVHVRVHTRYNTWYPMEYMLISLRFLFMHTRNI